MAVSVNARRLKNSHDLNGTTSFTPTGGGLLLLLIGADGPNRTFTPGGTLSASWVAVSAAFNTAEGDTMAVYAASTYTGSGTVDFAPSGGTYVDYTVDEILGLTTNEKTTFMAAIATYRTSTVLSNSSGTVLASNPNNYLVWQATQHGTMSSAGMTVLDSNVDWGGPITTEYRLSGAGAVSWTSDRVGNLVTLAFPKDAAASLFKFGWRR